MTKQYSTDQFRHARALDGARRIAIVVHSLNAGGAQRRLVTLANRFAAEGRKVDFVALRGGGDVDGQLDRRVRLTVLEPRRKPLCKPWFFEGWAKLSEWVSRNRPDVVLAGITTVHFTALVACRQQGDERPLLALRASRHPRRRFPWSRPFKRLFEPVERAVRWRIYDEADLVIAVSAETGEALRARLRRPERCVILPNPVITSAFVESLGKPPPHPWFEEETPVIVAVGRLAWQKRFDVLLEALAIARRTRPVRLIILGEGRLRRRLQAQLCRLALEQAVSLPGCVADVGAWISRARLLVSTSAFEGSPAALIEALAAGVPVVATRCPGGSEELLRSGIGGTLIPLADAEAAAAAIVEALYEAPSDRTALQRLVSDYHERASAGAYLAALDDALMERVTGVPRIRVAAAA